ncbi:UDP-4-amino-4,6-dideoxy-N-acetyl-beta-L-altrosamine N-acetyltransferase [Pseudomonas sp. L5B5]|uniref:UDP-4-amino-4, 6-dideoxy-N-acetyl-beta-L-altrosamine N-acetyltransferase n=1 Tax=Pseudomonas sp. L5B5 TaxID=2883205 RepID=UPI001CF94A4E|nr:UDP-4-amino-4,6-dideoxy-N-acetyl-beta-L-altrosamine N-acetyltransferase [Pseudomonas sp. L5B5]UCZ86360.1 UDP-4-amino-4,6-dideoxy-N-acetyl-beta-L-altrosamine N-acetyltransferase [Pseudomonas sp. L5B5]
MQFLPLLETSPEVQALVRSLRNQEPVRKHMYTAHEITEGEHQQWLASLKDNERQRVYVAIKDGQAVGVVSLNAINALHRTADWALYLDERQQGKGLGSIVEFWMLDHAFNEAGLEKLNCEVLETNAAVISMHQKFGFTLEGVRRKNVLKDGVRIDVALLGITKQEWASRRPALAPLIQRLSRLGPGH